jgi:hypothetical protein
MSGTEDARVVLCDECGSEGRIYHRSSCNPYEEVDCGPCSRCEGTGWMVVEVEPITEGDTHAAL